MPIPLEWKLPETSFHSTTLRPGKNFSASVTLFTQRCFLTNGNKTEMKSWPKVETRCAIKIHEIRKVVDLPSLARLFNRCIVPSREHGNIAKRGNVRDVTWLPYFHRGNDLVAWHGAKQTKSVSNVRALLLKLGIGELGTACRGGFSVALRSRDSPHARARYVQREEKGKRTRWDRRS